MVRSSCWVAMLIGITALLAVGCGDDDNGGDVPVDVPHETVDGDVGADADADAATCPGTPPIDSPCTVEDQYCEYPVAGCDAMGCRCTGGHFVCTGGHYCDGGGDTDAAADADADADVPVEAEAEAGADADADADGGDVTPPNCAALGGTCTDARWSICAAHFEPAAGDGHQDCSGSTGMGGWCCVPAPASACSDSGAGNCVEGTSCTGCWFPAEGTPACEAGRVCCVDYCD
jgi:hypothetical protein